MDAETKAMLAKHAAWLNEYADSTLSSVRAMIARSEAGAIRAVIVETRCLTAEVARLTRERDGLLLKVQALEKSLRDVDAALTVPAAEYVPAIGDAFKIIDATLVRENQR